MSFRNEIVITCDGKFVHSNNCKSKRRVVGDQCHSARKFIQREYAWTRRNGFDFCPDCSKIKETADD